MKLIHLLSVLSDNTTVLVLSCGSEIARFDGRNSIPEELNGSAVLCVYIENGEMVVNVRGE
ncbi:MAG: hypothetical protein IKF39_01855 [Oscillospiraceae bacterium]|nr:hypothetical protein [Oscillospiraceae bacterium]